MLRVQVSLPPPSHSAFFFFFGSQKTLRAFENFVVEVALPGAGFKLFITSGRLGHQLNTRVKQKMLKVYVLGAAVVFLTCPTGNGSWKNFLRRPHSQTWPGVFLRRVTELEWVRPSCMCCQPVCVSLRAHVWNSWIVAFGQNQSVYSVFKCDTSHV